MGLFTLLLGTPLPAYGTFKCIQANGDPRPWPAFRPRGRLRCWVVLAVYYQLEWLLELLGTNSVLGVANFEVIKLMALAYIVLPGSGGARYVYESLVGPFLEKHEETIDELLARANKQLALKLVDGKRALGRLLASMGQDVQASLVNFLGQLLAAQHAAAQGAADEQRGRVSETRIEEEATAPSGTTTGEQEKDDAQGAHKKLD